MSRLLRGFGGWLVAIAERLERHAQESATDDPWHDAQAQRRLFELRTRVHAGYY